MTQTTANAIALPPASREAARARLAAFLPRAGRAYARDRNFDLGPGRHENVSGLSPYLRHRLITEEEVVRAVVRAQGARAAEKFLQEVFWRTYWKGWLELRPSVWRDYCLERDRALARAADDAVLTDALARAEAGRTGIACFDAWTRELHDTGYLHNHARMWAASIWIFTLELPWALGADLFLRKLLDGDPASNTLSWRWVAGLQTRGKTYLARADNIATYTDGRFPRTPGLAGEAVPLDGPPHPPPLAPPVARPVDPAPATGLLVLDDDVAADDLAARLRPEAVTGLSLAAHRSTGQMSEAVTEFAAAAVDDTLDRLSGTGHAVTPRLSGDDAVAAALDWARAEGLTRLVTRHAPVGPGGEFLFALAPRLEAAGVALEQDLRPFDARAWPHATKGFFAFRKHIPDLIARLA